LPRMQESARVEKLSGFVGDLHDSSEAGASGEAAS
jgi:hypothetical protein